MSEKKSSLFFIFTLHALTVIIVLVLAFLASYNYVESQKSKLPSKNQLKQEQLEKSKSTKSFKEIQTNHE